MATPRPIFRDLTTDECLALLQRHTVGRMALSFRDRVEIVPIHYVYEAGWIYGRTALGTKVEMVAHNRWVAFEVDEVRDTFDWTSVVVKGGLYLLRNEGSAQEQAIYAKGVTLVRRIVPEALTPDDPLPERALLFRVHVDELSGRSAAPGTEPFVPSW
jgi:nitroimidazol reductase NimA-like FMN-containing flavoprotein (pyridoxamine 5'-phosphate oxidase superfamily)